ncbi:MAG: peroxiredoxin [Gammaproteobacteria bacterium]|nr:peroxiredoxin [Gammaproteobacteria bacterium]
MTVSESKKVGNFFAPATNNKDIKLSALKGYQLALFFYPRDATPGCTMEAQDFGAHYEDFKGIKTVVLGVSRDTLASHESFKLKENLPFELISDMEEALCKQFEVLKPKIIGGKTIIGVERSTFLIAIDGTLAKEWRGVNVAGHVTEVLASAKKLLPQ